MTPDQLPDPLAVALDVARVLERLGIAYLAAGSLASSVHGEPRSTNDVDLVVDLAAGQVPSLLQALGDRYYVSPEAVAEAAPTGGAFNLIHLGTAVKVDVFVAGDDPFEAASRPADARADRAERRRRAGGRYGSGATFSASSGRRVPGSTGTGWRSGQHAWAWRSC